MSLFELSGGTFSVVHVETVYIDSKAQRQTPDCQTRKVIIKTVNLTISFSAWSEESCKTVINLFKSLSFVFSVFCSKAMSKF